MEQNNKIIILGLILENEEILFGKLSENITHEMKINKWKEITEQIRSLGIYSKDWEYLRDTAWPNWRKRTMEKRDNPLQTGSGGGKNCTYDEEDKMILKIVGKQSPVIDSLCEPDSSGSNEAHLSESQFPNITETSVTLPLPTSPDRPVSASRRIFLRTSSNSSSSSSSSEDDIPDELHDLKLLKMEAEIKLAKQKVEIEKRKKYKLDLEILKLEK